MTEWNDEYIEKQRGIQGQFGPYKSALDEIRRLRAELDKRKWIPVSERLPEVDDCINDNIPVTRWTGNETEIVKYSFWCRFIFDIDQEQEYYDVVQFDFEQGSFVLMYQGEIVPITVTHWMPLPEPPEVL